MLLRHSALYLLARGLPGVINLAALALFTRLLAPDDYGRYALVIAGASLAGSLFFQWLQLGVLRFLAAEREREEVFLSTVLAGFLALALFSAFIGGGAWLMVTDPVWRSLIPAGVAFLLAQAFFDLNLEIVRSHLSPAAYGVATVAKALCALSIGWLAVASGLGAQGLILGTVAGLLLPLLWLVRRNWKGASPRQVDPGTVRRLLGYGMPLTVTFAFAFIVSSSDRFLLAWLIDEEAAGLYSVGYNLAQQTLLMLMMVVNLAAYPLAVKALESSGTEAARRQLASNGRMLLMIACPAATGMALLAPNISGVFLGPAFRGAAGQVIPWIALGILLSGIKAYYLDLSFQLGERTVHQVWVVMTAAVINLALNLWWIPLFGIVGAAYATVLAYLAGLLLSWWLSSRVFPMPLPRGIPKIVAATGGMALTLLAFRDGDGPGLLALQVLLGALVYGVILLILHRQELRVTWSVRLSGYRP